MTQAGLSRRGFLQTGAALGAAVVGRAAERPNVLLITTDQQSADAMSCRLGELYLKTPHMDALAAEGTAFSRAYCANPLCVPSRTSIFTGRYPVETGVETNDTSSIDARRFPCIGTHLKRAGYDTGFFGKWHLPYPQKQTAVHGFDIVRWERNPGDVRTAENTAEYIRSRKGAPFFVVASFLNPHNICEWARGEALSEGDAGVPPPPEQCPPRRANWAPQKDEPDAVALMRRSYQATPMFPVGAFDEAKWRRYIWAYYRMIEKVDEQIGRVLAALREAGLERDTLVAFTADHGDCQGAHGWNQKTILYEEAMRVPCILRWKGVTRAGVSKGLVQTGIDLLPTLCDFAGIETPRGMPGLSLKGAATGSGGIDAREYVVVSDHLVQGAEVGGRKPEPSGRMLRTQRYKYCVYSEGQRREELVDIEKDPGEMVNLAAHPEYAAVLKRHRELLAAWCKRYGDEFPVVTAP